MDQGYVWPEGMVHVIRHRRAERWCTMAKRHSTPDGTYSRNMVNLPETVVDRDYDSLFATIDKVSPDERTAEFAIELSKKYSSGCMVVRSYYKFGKSAIWHSAIDGPCINDLAGMYGDRNVPVVIRSIVAACHEGKVCYTEHLLNCWFDATRVAERNLLTNKYKTAIFVRKHDTLSLAARAYASHGIYSPTSIKISPWLRAVIDACNGKWLMY